MKIKIIVLDFETPKWLRKAIAYGAPIVGVLVVAGIALAAPHQWKTNDPLAATDLNGLNVLTNGSTHYSVGATSFCGLSATQTNGNIIGASTPGYGGAKAMCEASPGCKMSPSAHMCTSEELVRSRALGITLSNGWYSTGTWVNATNMNVDECDGWTNSTATNLFGAYWGTGPDRPGADFCSSMHFVLCCD